MSVPYSRGISSSTSMYEKLLRSNLNSASDGHSVLEDSMKQG